MESQMALSMAVELGIKPTTSATDVHYFYMYGSKYYYMTVDGMTAPLDGQMNARVYKVMDYGYTDATDGHVNCEFCLRMSLYSGAMLAGDVFVYDGGGAELVAKTTNTTSDSYGNAVGFWLETDQKKWKNITGVTIDGTAKFGFEDSYRNILPLDGNTVTKNNSWRRERTPYAPFANTSSSASRGDCMYIYNDNGYNTAKDGAGKLTRLALRFGLIAAYDVCAPRSLRAASACNAATRYFAGRAQALVRRTQ